MQLLPPRQRAVLLLRDVLGFAASEAARILGTTEESVTSALKRARATLRRRQTLPAQREPPPPPESAAEKQLIERLTRAYETGDVDGIIALFTDDAWLTMPPAPLEYQGHDPIARFLTQIAFRHGRTYRLVPTRANGQLAFGAYLHAPRPGDDTGQRPARAHPQRRPRPGDDPFHQPASSRGSACRPLTPDASAKTVTAHAIRATAPRPCAQAGSAKTSSPVPATRVATANAAASGTRGDRPPAAHRAAPHRAAPQPETAAVSSRPRSTSEYSTGQRRHQHHRARSHPDDGRDQRRPPRRGLGDGQARQQLRRLGRRPSPR